MKKVLKWILYIVLGLLVLVVATGVIVAVFGAFRWSGYGMMRPGLGMMEHVRFYNHPGQFFFGGLLCLGIILLVIVGIVAMIYALTHRNQAALSAPPAQPVAAPIEPGSAVAEETAPTRNCGNCGKAAAEDWKTCPYCGNPLD